VNGNAGQAWFTWLMRCEHERGTYHEAAGGGNGSGSGSDRLGPSKLPVGERTLTLGSLQPDNRALAQLLWPCSAFALARINESGGEDLVIVTMN
jgi:hypothetical protein